MTTRRVEEDLWQLFWGALVTRLLATTADLGIADALADGPRPVGEALARSGPIRTRCTACSARSRATVCSPRRRRGSETPRLPRACAAERGGTTSRTCSAVSGTRRSVAHRRRRAHLRARPRHRLLELARRASGRARGVRSRHVRKLGGKADRVADAGWRGDELVVDVGGGNGALLVELLRRRPGLRGVVFDLPETTRDEAAFGGRIEFVAGSFFERVPPGDVYVLSTILHDWDDDRAGQILRAIRAAAPDEGRLLVVDAVVPAETSRTARSSSTC